MENEVLLHCKSISKSFAVTKALSDVTLTVYHGDIRGLIGENGSGKSTISSIISGMLDRDSGELSLRGKPYDPKTMVQAQQEGVSMIMQEAGTVLGITVAANIFLGKESKFSRLGLLQLQKMNRAAKEALERIHADHIDPTVMIDDLNFEDRKLVEIARAIYDSPELLIIDETTTALSEKGRAIVYNIMRDMAEHNKAVLFISHDLDELMSICNSITVLRDGIMIDTLTSDEMEINKLRELMVGREILGSYYRSDMDGSYGEKVVLKAEQITLEEEVENLTLELHEGEILGIGGLTECGMHEIGKAIYGAKQLLTGKVNLADGTKIKNSRIALEHRLGYVSKNRDVEALLLDASIQDNITLPSLKMLSKCGLISRRRERSLATKMIETMRIKCTGGNQWVSALSGGNKQKVVFAKWLGNKSEIFILDCPTRGIDVGVKAEMYHLMYQLKKEGKSILMISEELPELIGMSDRVIIMKNGKISGEFHREEELTEQKLIQYII